MKNFSNVMATVVKRYGGYVHIDPINDNNDIFICPKCRDYIIRGDWNDYIEQLDDGEDIKYICPICKQKF